MIEGHCSQRIKTKISKDLSEPKKHGRVEGPTSPIGRSRIKIYLWCKVMECNWCPGALPSMEISPGIELVWTEL